MSRAIAMFTRSYLLIRTECGNRLAWAKGPEEVTEQNLDEGLAFLGFSRCSLSLVYRTGVTPPEAIPVPAGDGS
jgi:hypothetical protein